MSSTQADRTPAALKADAISIVQDLTQRFQALQRWYQQCQSRLDQRAQSLSEREAEVDQIESDQKHKATKITRRREAQKRYRTKLEQHARELDQRQQTLHTEQQRIHAHAQALTDQQSEVARLREELDHEWQNLTRIRRSQEALTAALDTDRRRINQQRFRLGPNAQTELQSDQFTPQAA